MSESPFVRHEDGRLSLSLHEGPLAGASFSVARLVCPDPLCRCTDITLQCTAAEPNEPVLEFVLDFASRGVRRLDEMPLSQAENDLAEGLVAEMGDMDWQWLHEGFLREKQILTEQADCAKLPAVFPADVMRNPGVMVFYKEVLPYGGVLYCMIGEDQWLVEDRYCVNPKCDCMDTILDFLRITTGEDGTPKVAQHMPGIVYSLRDGTSKPYAPPWNETPTMEALMQALNEAYPALGRDLRARRKRLRVLYREAVKRANPALAVSPKATAPPPPGADAGPNAPCRCGSGKKFKKCCGRFFAK